MLLRTNIYIFFDTFKYSVMYILYKVCITLSVYAFINIVNARRELNELYRIYQQEIQELNNGRNSDLGHLTPYGSLYRVSKDLKYSYIYM